MDLTHATLLATTGAHQLWDATRTRHCRRVLAVTDPAGEPLACLLGDTDYFMRTDGDAVLRSDWPQFRGLFDAAGLLATTHEAAATALLESSPRLLGILGVLKFRGPEMDAAVLDTVRRRPSTAYSWIVAYANTRGERWPELEQALQGQTVLAHYYEVYGGGTTITEIRARNIFAAV